MKITLLKHTLPLIGLLLLLLTSCGSESLVRKAEQSYALGEYYDAATLYKRPTRRPTLKNTTNEPNEHLKWANAIDAST